MYGPQGVRCNAICPGATKTNIGESMDPTKLDQAGFARASAFNNIVPGMLESEDIAALALFLASDESRNINGAIIPADAGWRTV
jgi:NAD(P)-dependent dehydrogenase (short-subunit alcohol dehydrogenase family)